VLSNNGLCIRTDVQCVLLFLVLAANSDQFQNLLHALTLAVYPYPLLSELIGILPMYVVITATINVRYPTGRYGWHRKPLVS